MEYLKQLQIELRAVKVHYKQANIESFRKHKWIRDIKSICSCYLQHQRFNHVLKRYNEEWMLCLLYRMVCCELTLTINNISYLCFEWQFEQITRRCDDELAPQFKVKITENNMYSWHYSTDDIADLVCDLVPEEFMERLEERGYI